MIHNTRSYKGRTEDALASGGDEGRGKLRKCAGICKQDLIRTYPNGTTRQVEGLSLEREPTRRTETSKYPQEKKETSISRVVASEMETA